MRGIREMGSTLSSKVTEFDLKVTWLQMTDIVTWKWRLAQAIIKRAPFLLTDGPTPKLLCVSMGKMNRIITFWVYALKGKNKNYRNKI